MSIGVSQSILIADQLNSIAVSQFSNAQKAKSALNMRNQCEMKQLNAQLQSLTCESDCKIGMNAQIACSPSMMFPDSRRAGKTFVLLKFVSAHSSRNNFHGASTASGGMSFSAFRNQSAVCISP
jgi:hypothetical protein